MKQLINFSIITVWVVVVAIAIYFAFTLQVQPDVVDKGFRQNADRTTIK